MRQREPDKSRSISYNKIEGMELALRRSLCLTRPIIWKTYSQIHLDSLLTYLSRKISTSLLNTSELVDLSSCTTHATETANIKDSSNCKIDQKSTSNNNRSDDNSSCTSDNSQNAQIKDTSKAKIEQKTNAKTLLLLLLYDIIVRCFSSIPDTLKSAEHFLFSFSCMMILTTPFSAYWNCS